MLRTPLHALLPSLKSPIVLGPMANAAGGSLASQVSKAGGLGFIGAGYYTPTQLTQELAIVQKALLPQQEGATSPTRLAGKNRLEVGIGFLAWRLTKINTPQGSSEPGSLPPTLGSSDLPPGSQALDLIDAALKARPRAIWLSFGAEEELLGWSRIVREREAALNGGGKTKWGQDLKLFVGVGSVEEGKFAAEEMGADVLAVQGIEAGGHGNGSSPPLSSLLPLVRCKLSSWKPSNPSSTQPLLLGAGGLHSGSTLVSTLSLGAHGAVFGTRFLFCPEAAYSDAQKKMLVEAKEGQTCRTMAFDEARGTIGWPEGVDGRGITNDTVKDFKEGKGDSSSRRERYKEAEAAGDTKRIVTWAGSGVGNVDRIQPAAEIVQEIEAEAIEELKRLQGYLVHE